MELVILLMSIVSTFTLRGNPRQAIAATEGEPQGLPPLIW